MVENRVKSFATLSTRAKLLLAQEQGIDTEFKQSPGGLDAADIVAFANSPIGGAILIGVTEERAANGRQVGRVVGSDTSDKARLQVLDKALSCVPPVPVELFVENASKTPFLRLEIPAGPQKPYGT